MPKISEDIIRMVLEQAKIEDVVGDFVTLRKAGVNMTGICPFHDDKHDGNFIVRPSTISEANHGKVSVRFTTISTTATSSCAHRRSQKRTTAIPTVVSSAMPKAVPCNS